MPRFQDFPNQCVLIGFNLLIKKIDLEKYVGAAGID